MSKKKMTLKELDFNNAGSWPREWQIGFCVALCLLILFLLWNFLTRPKGAELETLEAEEASLRADFETKQGEAANLEPLKQQLALMEQQLQQMLRQLPSKTEMPALIVDISQTALATGITNELFQPGDETQLEFYVEKPIELKMVGSYHQFGAFVSGVASLPRVVIMTMHDIQLTPRGTPGDKKPASIGPGSVLELKGTVKTYRYRDEEESVDTGAAAGGNTAGGATPGVPGANAVTNAANRSAEATAAQGGSR
ncbi:MAG: type 4a pilus biogenesis protein PilO [Lysobacter sp.]|nr:type 4a pilus biogenesis protein PilO [Lysobacter sp.]